MIYTVQLALVCAGTVSAIAFAALLLYRKWVSEARISAMLHEKQQQAGK